jgi:hypothetical protein
VLKVFIASRPLPDIDMHLKAFQNQRELISISTSDNSGDIEKFVIDEMAKYSEIWSEIAQSTKELVKKTLVERSDGM